MLSLCNQFHKFQHILRWCIQSKNRLAFLTPKTDFRNFWGHVWVICSLVQSVKAALPQCNGHERANIILIKMFDQLQYILEIVCWEKMKIWFLTSKINFWNFWGHFWVISSLIQSVKAALPQCKGLKKAKIILFNVLDKLQFILEWFVEIKWKFDFLTWKKWFSKFLRSFLTHSTSKAEKTLKPGYFVGLRKNWDLKSKICSQGFVRNVLKIILVCLTWS